MFRLFVTKVSDFFACFEQKVDANCMHYYKCAMTILQLGKKFVSPVFFVKIKNALNLYVYKKTHGLYKKENFYIKFDNSY